MHGEKSKAFGVQEQRWLTVEDCIADMRKQGAKMNGNIVRRLSG